MATLAARGSFLTAEDFAAHRGRRRDADLRSNYRGLDVLEIPPNGQGLTALVLLNILENFDLEVARSVRRRALPHRAGSGRAGVSRCATLTSPIRTHMRVAVPALLDKGFARSARGENRSRRGVSRCRSTPSPGNDTVCLTVVDRDRMAVSFINSLFSAFGSGICTEKSGIMLQQPRRRLRGRPRSSRTRSAPASGRCTRSFRRMAMRDGRCEMSFGVMGSHYQPMGHAQVIANMIDYGMDVQPAIDAPRVFFDGESDGGRTRRRTSDDRGTARARARRGAGGAAVGRRSGDSRSTGNAAC